MANVSEKDVIKFLDYIGTGKGSKRKERNLYKILGVVPEVDDDGNRIPTPYEILQTPPQFRNGKEVPIIFALKNRVKKIGKYLGSEKIFYYINRKVKDEASIDGTLEELKKKYKHAIFVGNAEEALAYLELLESLTGSQIEEVMGSYYNYALFYKRMKKQLLMDMFAHFFLTYFFRYRNNIREGLINRSEHFRPYFEKTSLTLSGNDLNQISEANIFGDAPQVDFSGIKSIKFENMDMGYDDMPSVSSAPEPPKMNIPNIVPSAPVTVSNVESVSETNQSKTQEAKQEPPKILQDMEAQKDSELVQEERQSYVRIPKSVKSKLYDVPDFSSKKSENEEQQEDTKSFN